MRLVSGSSAPSGGPRQDRRTSLADFGVDDAVFLSSAQWAHGPSVDEDRPDVVIEAIGHQVSTLEHSLDAVRPGGRIFYFGIPDDSVYPLNMEYKVVISFGSDG